MLAQIELEQIVEADTKLKVHLIILNVLFAVPLEILKIKYGGIDQISQSSELLRAQMNQVTFQSVSKALNLSDDFKIGIYLVWYRI